MEFKFKISEEARKAIAIETGNLLSTTVKTDLDLTKLTKEERKLILDHTSQYGDFKINGYTSRELSSESLDEKSIVKAVEAAIAEEKKVEEKKEKAAQERIQKDYERFIAGETAYLDGEHLIPGVAYPNESINWEKINSVILPKYTQEEQEVIIKRLKTAEKELTEQKAEKAAKKEAERIQVEENQKIMTTWIEEHGSNLLKLRHKHGQNFKDLYEEEYGVWFVKNNVKGIDIDELTTEVDSDDYYPIKNADLEELQLLEKMKDEGFDVALDRHRFEDDFYDYLVFKVAVPAARTQYVYSFIKNYTPEKENV